MNRKYLVRSQDNVTVVSCIDILYCVASGAYTHIYLVNGEKHTVSKSLGKVASELPSGYLLRLSQSNLANLHYLQCIHYKNRTVELKEGTCLRYTLKRSVLDDCVNQFFSRPDNADLA